MAAIEPTAAKSATLNEEAILISEILLTFQSGADSPITWKCGVRLGPQGER